jgi:hypothetical protein
VAVAQLVESRIVIPVVVGSSPISHPSISSKKPLQQGLFLLVDRPARAVQELSGARLEVRQYSRTSSSLAWKSWNSSGLLT